jgi:amino acid transporter
MDTLAGPVPALAGGAPRLAALFAVYVVLCVVNIRGVRSGARVSLALAIVKIAPLIVLIIAGMFVVSRTNLQWTAVPAIPVIGQASVLLFFAFMGVEGGLNASGEVTNPARTVPRAILLALTVVAALYVGLQTVAQGVLGAALPGETSPLVATATAIFGTWGGRALIATTAVSVAGFLSADMLGSPRIFHAMAERRQLPGWFSAVHPRFRTPAAAIVMYALMCAVVASTGSFRQLALAAASGTLVIYLICCVGVLPLRRRNEGATSAPFVAPGGALVPLAASAIIVWMLSTLAATEIAAAALLVVVSSVGYLLQETFWRKADAERTIEVSVPAGAVAELRVRRQQPPSV